MNPELIQVFYLLKLLVSTAHVVTKVQFVVPTLCSIWLKDLCSHPKRPNYENKDWKLQTCKYPKDSCYHLTSLSEALENIVKKKQLERSKPEGREEGGVIRHIEICLSNSLKPKS